MTKNIAIIQLPYLTFKLFVFLICELQLWCNRQNLKYFFYSTVIFHMYSEIIFIFFNCMYHLPRMSDSRLVSLSIRPAPSVSDEPVCTPISCAARSSRLESSREVRDCTELSSRLDIRNGGSTTLMLRLTMADLCRRLPDLGSLCSRWCWNTQTKVRACHRLNLLLSQRLSHGSQVKIWRKRTPCFMLGRI